MTSDESNLDFRDRSATMQNDEQEFIKGWHCERPTTCDAAVPDAPHHHQGGKVHGGELADCLMESCNEDQKLNAVQEDLIKQTGDILRWWIDTAHKDAEKTAPKAVQYGAADLEIMGQAMVGLLRDKFIGADDAELMRVGREMATAFYALGKVARLFGAYEQGMLPSEDTWFDLNVYSIMARRIRETGKWV